MKIPRPPLNAYEIGGGRTNACLIFLLCINMDPCSIVSKPPPPLSGPLRETQAAVKISCATNPMSPHLSSYPGCGRELVDGVHVSLLDVDAADDELLGLLAVHVVQVERVDLGSEMAANLSRRNWIC